MATAAPFRSIERTGKIDVLQSLTCLRLEDLLEHMEVPLRRVGRMYAGSCPVHGGNNLTALNLYMEGHSVPGYWRCYTRHCERTFKPTILGFVRGVLSHRKHGWGGGKDEKACSFNEAVKFLCDFIGQSLDDLEIDPTEVEKRRHAATIGYFGASQRPQQAGLPRSQVRRHLHIPADYYVARGYTAGVLDAYDVGLYRHADREMSDRVVVPVYGDDGKLAIGFAGRSIHPKCERCQLWHEVSRPCPATQQEGMRCAKWVNSKGFSTHSYLYNYWSARKYVRESGVIVLVEGPGDVWRLEEAGIHNACALFGVDLSDEQQVLVERSGAMTVVLLLDMDKAGREAVEQLVRRLRSFNVLTPTISHKDIGEVSVETIQKDILPLIPAGAF